MLEGAGLGGPVEAADVGTERDDLVTPVERKAPAALAPHVGGVFRKPVDAAPHADTVPDGGYRHPRLGVSL